MSLKPFLPALTLFLALPALAQTLPAPRLVAAISGDWDADHELDAATITVDDSGSTVFTLYRGDAVEGLRPLITLDDVIWSGTWAGTLPAFEPRSDTSFAILTQQSAVGRNPWYQSVTIAYRDGDYRVAGFDYDTYDRLDPDHSATCSVNLLTGGYELRIDPEGPAPEERRSGQGQDRAFPLSQLTEGYSPAVCQPAYQ